MTVEFNAFRNLQFLFLFVISFRFCQSYRDFSTEVGKLFPDGTILARRGYVILFIYLSFRANFQPSGLAQLMVWGE